jgi:hypothetical protein
MKKQLHLILLPLIVSAACTPKKQADSVTTQSLLQVPAGAVNLSTHNHQIPFDSAALLISDLFKMPALSNMVTTYALGGTFPVNDFNIGKDSSGVILWSCFKPGPKPELFLALERLHKYDTTNVPPAPLNKILTRPEFTFKDSNPQHNAPAIERYLETQVIPNNGSKPIDNATVAQHIHSFDSLQKTMPEKYNARPFSYFQRNDDGIFEKFLDQARPNGFVRYYFGYETKVPNKIRVILVAVDSAGRNIIRTASGEAILMEASWPPPPWHYY